MDGLLADEVVAAIGEQILGPTDVSLSNWTVRPSSGCSVVLATHRGNRTLCARSSSPAGTGSARPPTSWMSEADNVYDPLYGSFVGDQSAWSTAKMYFTVPPNGVAKLHFGAHFQAPGLPNQTAGTVDVYGLQILDATLEAGNTAEAEDTVAYEFLDGGADDVTLGNFLVRSNSQSSVTSASFTVPAGGLRHDPERPRLEHRAHLHTDAGETLLLRLPVQAGHGLQLGDVPRASPAPSSARPRRASGARRAWTSRRRRPESQSCTSAPSAGRSPGWCSSRRARWTCTACRSGPAPSRESRSP